MLRERERSVLLTQLKIQVETESKRHVLKNTTDKERISFHFL